MKMPSRTSVYLALIFAAAVAIVVYFMPGDNRHKYSYEVNRPWTYDLLTAPIDIPVYRDSLTIKQMTDSIDRAMVPIFQYDRSAEGRILQAVDNDRSLSPATRQRLHAVIKGLYDRGIIGASTAALIAEGGHKEVKFNVDNVNRITPVAGFISQRDAYARLDSAFINSPERAKIQALSLANLLAPNIVEDTKATEQYRETLIQPVVAAVGVIQKGERIIDRGDRVSPQLYQVLKSYELALEKSGHIDRNRMTYTVIGHTMVVACIFLALFLYFRLYYPDQLLCLKRMLAVVSLMVVFFIFSAVMAKGISHGLYIVPLAMLPVVIQVFFNSRTAFFVYTLEILLVMSLSVFPLEFVFLEILTGIVVIFSLQELSKRSQLLRSALFAFFTYLIAYVAVEMVSAGSPGSLSGRVIGYFAINTVLISFAYILIFIIEKAFGMTSVVTLVELADINSPLLRQLSQECPGTFQHSMAVSNLASEAAHNIGANVQLVRAGALYHDIGKIDNPAFFTENQYGINPHDALSPEQSARIITGHVRDGVKRAEKYQLPQVIIDFILQHHGAGTAKYFYLKEQQEHPGEKVDPAPFSYPGPNPQTRETSLLMMADSVEAASRSLKDHSEAAIAELVDRLINQQVKDGLHDQSPLSFRDIATIKATFIKRLRSMYHGRISYPPEKK